MDDQGDLAAGLALAAPLQGERPAGEDLRQDFTAGSPYYRLRDLRSEAREIERRLDHGDPEADSAALLIAWRTVRELAVKALTERTKDLEIAVWLTEALVRLEGLSGITTGATLIAELADVLWDEGLYPLPDEDGIEGRTAPVTGLNGASGDGTLMQPLRKCPLFPGPDGEMVSYWQYAQSRELETIADEDRRKQWLASGVQPFDAMEAAARRAGAAHFTALRRLLQGALQAWTRMGEVLDARAGADGPPTGRVRDLLRAMLDITIVFAPPDDPDDDAMAEAEPAEAPADGAPAQGAAAARPAVTREDMLRELIRIADYFRRTEPQSPLAYTLDDAVRRGRMSWPELLAELVTDDSTRNAMLTSLGIRPPQPPRGEDE
ncbi:type VI secretion system protein TssA [Rhodopila sp.]|uniref:type VI secretion system protein TssA n=1 Tax=Rhodopila sp. TaxID=2480087 RepID=UPI002CD299EB|nr:type VI secretion system protein TssA [Rhodopila sp.]HVZ09615.1 type VI secretion system protein TssA [Rhodopila sp.]